MLHLNIWSGIPTATKAEQTADCISTLPLTCLQNWLGNMDHFLTLTQLQQFVMRQCPSAVSCVTRTAWYKGTRLAKGFWSSGRAAEPISAALHLHPVNLFETWGFEEIKHKATCAHTNCCKLCMLGEKDKSGSNDMAVTSGMSWIQCAIDLVMMDRGEMLVS